MSTRALRKAKVKEEKETADALSETSSEEHVKSNPFDLLGGGQDPVEDEDLINGQDESQDDEEPRSPVTVAPAKKELRKKSGKGKKKAKEKKERPQQIQDEFHSAFKELSVKEDPETDKETPINLTSLLCVDTRLLNADAEMRKLFGRKVVESSVRRPRRATGRPGVLAQHKEEWPPLSKGGLSMDLIDRDDGVLFFRFLHSSAYLDVQQQFQLCVRSYGARSLNMTLMKIPKIWLICFV